MTRNISMWLGLSIIMLLAVTLTVTAQPSTEFSIEEEILGALPSGYVEDSLVFSHDGEVFAVVVDASGGQRVVLNGQNEGELFQRIGNIRFAPSTNKLFYWALQGVGGNQQIVLVAEGDVIPTSFTGEGSIFFSNNGEHWATVRGEENGVTILLDGELLGRYPDATFPSFNYDGEHLAYLTQDEDNQISLVIDGEVEETYASPEVEASFHFQAYLNGSNLPPLFSVDYLSNGSLLILTQDEDGWTIYKDDEVLSSYLHNIWGGGSDQVITFEGFETAASILARSLTYPLDAPFAFWWERLEGEEEQWRVVQDGTPVDDIVCTSFWDSQFISLSADGEHYGYPCISQEGDNDTQVSVVNDGTEYGPYVNVWGVTVSQNGEHFAYAASDGSEEQSWSYYLDGDPSELQYDSIWPPQLSPDGSNIVWKAKREEESFILAINGQEVVEERNLLWGPVFEVEGNMVWLAEDENTVVRSVLNVE